MATVKRLFEFVQFQFNSEYLGLQHYIFPTANMLLQQMEVTPFDNVTNKQDR